LLEAQVQEVIQDLCWCEVADEPVVVIKFRPLKASNGVEGKTGMIISIKSDEVVMSQKP
jgi:methionyl-tRNA formyltransferase